MGKPYIVGGMGRRVVRGGGVAAAVCAAACALGCGDDGGSAAATTASGTSDGETTGPATTSTTGPMTGGSTGEGTTGGPELDPFAACFVDAYVEPFFPTNYDPLGVSVGDHCFGTDHQMIEGVERVVFLGDSVTVGTPPTPVADYYRNRLADILAGRFGLSFDANKSDWQTPDIATGQARALDSGDFSSCAEFGGRNDDLLSGQQLAQCFPDGTRDLRTLTIMTSGGNDAASLARDAGEGMGGAALMAEAQAAVDEKRATMEWLVDPANFPAGNFVVFANVYEFTDATAEVEACPGAALAGLTPIPDKEAMLFLVAWMENEYAKIAVETGTDFIFMFEEFCGHGHNADNPASPCYRGSGSENWFDATCIHPTPSGHGVLTEMFLAVIDQ